LQITGDPVNEPIETVIQKFLRAIEAGDEITVRALYSDDVAIWHNDTDDTVSKEPNIARLAGLWRAGVQVRYSLDEQFVIGNRLIRRHRVETITRNGQRFVFPVAMFATVEGSKIVRLHEYIDAKQVDVLMAAMAS
jgi:ketosteroid isomerase-like protein